MIGIHPVHRRMAEIHTQAMRLGGYEMLPYKVQCELQQCVVLNATIVMKLDGLKTLALHAQEMNDMDWVAELCGKIDELETLMI
ncbi:DUF7667 family protein [Paenibacillus sedimenti]|uniref:Uncharacterized protein n=1 Tax=Paenibacillus sedimenti TaxID=2770274 RepID=A0A926KSI8_9BACL|nr:hypothetical protein [Paenibacillus sedimenti]MBD0381245.1 hypothetical protein [Paenibacillus sedimenti]